MSSVAPFIEPRNACDMLGPRHLLLEPERDWEGEGERDWSLLGLSGERESFLLVEELCCLLCGLEFLDVTLDSRLEMEGLGIWGGCMDILEGREGGEGWDCGERDRVSGELEVA